MNYFGYLLQDTDLDTSKKAFLGLGFGPGGVPIDVVPLHLLGKLLPDFTLLVVDEFAKFNSGDGGEQIKSLMKTLDRLDEVYGKTPRFLCSSFMESDEYQEILTRLEPVILSNDELRNIARRTVPSSYRTGDLDLRYPINEVACVAHLHGKGFRTKLGPDREKKYDKLMRYLDTNGRYGFKGFLGGMEFLYTRPSLTLSGREVEPYSTTHRGDRLLLRESEDDVVRRLEDASEDALRYLLTIGSVACYVLGQPHDLSTVDRLEGRDLVDVAKETVVNGIVRPYNRR